MGTDDLFKRKKDQRKKRENAIRETRKNIWLIVCEGEKTEPNYFNGLAGFFNENGSKTVKIRAEGKGRNTESLVDNLDEYFEFVDRCYGSMNIKYSNIIFVFDKDSFSDKQFNNAIRKAKDYEQKGINEVVVAWSNESFELWLCLHFDLIESCLTRDQYNQKLTNIFRESNILKSTQNYKKHGKSLDTIFADIINSGGDVTKAMRNSRKLYDKFGLNKTPSNSNPCTMVHKAVEVLARDSGYNLK